MRSRSSPYLLVLGHDFVTPEARAWRAGAHALGGFARTRGERVEVPVGAPQVHPPEHPRHDELAECERVADGEPVGNELTPHEVGRVPREDDEPEVPGHEEERRGDD